MRRQQATAARSPLAGPLVVLHADITKLTDVGPPRTSRAELIINVTPAWSSGDDGLDTLTPHARRKVVFLRWRHHLDRAWRTFSRR